MAPSERTAVGKPEPPSSIANTRLDLAQLELELKLELELELEPIRKRFSSQVCRRRSSYYCYCYKYHWRPSWRLFLGRQLAELMAGRLVLINSAAPGGKLRRLLNQRSARARETGGSSSAALACQRASWRNAPAKPPFLWAQIAPTCSGSAAFYLYALAWSSRLVGELRRASLAGAPGRACKWAKLECHRQLCFCQSAEAPPRLLIIGFAARAAGYVSPARIPRCWRKTNSLGPSRRRLSAAGCWLLVAGCDSI